MHSLVFLTACLCSPAPAGTFTNPERIASLVDSDSVISGDLNKDGRTELRGRDDGRARQRDGPGKGAVSSPEIQGELFAADFGGDGKVDLLANDSSRAPYILIGRGDGTFKDLQAASGITAALSTSSGSMGVVGDIDGDGKADLLLPSSSSQSSTYSLVAGLSTGNGGFRSVATTFTAPPCPMESSSTRPALPSSRTSPTAVSWTRPETSTPVWMSLVDRETGTFDTTPASLPIPRESRS